MNTILPPEQPSWIRRHRVPIFWLTGSLLFILFILGFGWLQRYQTQRKIDAKLAAIRSQGLPTNFHELNDYYPSIPDTNNAALLLTQVRSQMVDWDITDNWIGIGSNSVLYVTNPITPAARTILQSVMGSNQSALKLIYEAVTKPQCRYPIDFNLGTTAFPHHIVDVKQMTHLLRLEALCHLAENHKRDALKSVEASLFVTESLRKEPTLISFLVRRACLAVTLHSLEDLLQRTNFDSTDLKQLQDELLRSEQGSDIFRTLYGERAYVIGSWHEPASQQLYNPATPFDEWPEPLQKLGWAFYEKGGAKEADLLNFLSLCEQQEAALKLNPAAGLQQSQMLEKRFASSGKPSMDMIATTDLATTMLKTVEQNNGLIARLRVTQTALALERFRVENQRLPKTLGELIPQYLKSTPIDPFTDKPLLYRVTGKGFRVYSVGKNQRNDGGLTKSEEPKSDKNDDIVFAVEHSTSLTQP